MSTKPHHNFSAKGSIHDVVVIGAGPTGLTAAALLAREGHDVLTLECQPQKYGLPRAGHIDHQIVRILQGLEAHAPIFDDAPDPEPYTWYNGDGEVLLSFLFGAKSISGYQNDFMIFQPVLDDSLYEVLDRYPQNTAVRMGAEVVGLEQKEESVILTVADVERDSSGKRFYPGTRFEVEARYVIAADGAGSRIRDRIGATRTGPAIDERWYTVDVTVKAPLPKNINGQWCDPARPTYIGALGQSHHRFEMKVLPHERDEDFDEDFTWEILGKWGVTPEHIDFYRRVVYSFEAKVADRWNIGRVFLAGDAAHTMPPFMGQGLCSGMRDSANLAWKLDLMLRNVSEEALLQTYQSERKPHTQAWSDISVAIGAVSCELDPAAAATRDQQFFNGTHPPLPGPPAIGPGAFRNERCSTVVSPSGDFFPQGVVYGAGLHGLFHDVVGSGFILLTASKDVTEALSAPSREFLDVLNTTVVSLGDGVEPGTIVDSAGVYAEYFAGRGAVAVLVRPDYYVFGVARASDDLDVLVTDLRHALSSRNPVHEPA